MRSLPRQLALDPEPPPLRQDAAGVIRIGRPRVTLESVIGLYEQGASAEEIGLRFDALDLHDIYATLGYYLGHRQQVQSYLDRQQHSSRTGALADPAFFATARLDSRGGYVVWIEDDLEMAADNLRNLAVEQAGGIGHERLANWMAERGLTQERAAHAIKGKRVRSLYGSRRVRFCNHASRDCRKRRDGSCLSRPPDSQGEACPRGRCCREDREVQGKRL